MSALLDVRGLSVTFATRSGPFKAVDDIDVVVEPDEVLAIVGESGSGKSVAMLAIMGLLPWVATVRAERMVFAGRDLKTLTPKQRRDLVGRDIAMVFQEPMTSLNPCFTVGWQIGETLATHLKLERRARRTRVVELLEQVGIPDAARRASAFPHQLSGGMNQRVMIAMALACKPRLLIADEPTTALDVTIQAQILELLMQLRREHGMSLVLITHDLGVVAEVADRVIVQYAGRQVETQRCRLVVRAPAPSVHGRVARGAARARAAPTIGRDPRRRARAVGSAWRLCVRAALHVRERPVSARRTHARRRLVRPRAVPHAAAPRCAHRPLHGDRGMIDNASPVMQAVQLHRHYARAPRSVRRRCKRCARSTACRSRSRPAARSPWWANRVAASRRWRAC